MGLIDILDTGIAAVERMLTPYREQRTPEPVRPKLDVVAASAARSEKDPSKVECLLVGHGGKAWEFDLGPVAAETFSRLLDEAWREVLAPHDQ